MVAEEQAQYLFNTQRETFLALIQTLFSRQYFLKEMPLKEMVILFTMLINVRGEQGYRKSEMGSM